MPLRSSLARSLQYAMANMADIKTPLCALQPTPAIPHTASRNGAGTRGGGGARARGRAPARSARPANPRRPPASLLAAPTLRGPGGGRAGRGRLGARTPGAFSSVLLSLSRTRSLSHARSLPAPFSDRQTTSSRKPALRKATAGELRGGAITRGWAGSAPVTPASRPREGRGRRWGARAALGGGEEGRSGGAAHRW